MPIRIDERLTNIVSLVQGKSVADIGCDHGKLSYYLIGTDRAERVIATDISAPSLKKTQQLALENGVQESLITRLGDGLEPIMSNEVETVVIAGLGGDIISKILMRSHYDKKEFSCFVLSPNTHAEKVRMTLSKLGHRIIFDDIIFCSGKHYPIIKSVLGESDLLDELQIEFGKYYKTSDNFKIFASNEIKTKEDILSRNKSSLKLRERIIKLKIAIGEENEE